MIAVTKNITNNINDNNTSQYDNINDNITPKFVIINLILPTLVLIVED